MPKKAAPRSSAAILILVVEDNPGDARLVQEGMRGNTVRATLRLVGDGIEALRFLRRDGEHREAPRPDLILLDLGLPKMDGRRVLAEIRGDPKLGEIPVVVYTSSPADADVLLAFNLRADGFLRKPLAVREFLALIRRLGIPQGGARAASEPSPEAELSGRPAT